MDLYAHFCEYKASFHTAIVHGINSFRRLRLFVPQAPIDHCSVSEEANTAELGVGADVPLDDYSGAVLAELAVALKIRVIHWLALPFCEKGCKRG